MFDCSEQVNLPTFDIIFGDYWFPVRPEDYLEEQPSSNDCLISLYSDDSGVWNLGLSFLRGYYSIHDYTNKRMGFIPLSEE